MRKDVIIMGSRGYTKPYGGWETLVHGMIDNWKEPDTNFYVIEATDNEKEPWHEIVNGVHCIRVYIKDTGKFKMLKAEAKTLDILPKIIEEFNIEYPILYVLGMRVGAYFVMRKQMLKKYHVAIVYNSDGIGWKRAKYSPAEKVYSYTNSLIFNRFMTEYLVCDANEMRNVLAPQFKGRKEKPYTVTIYYGTNTAPVLPESMPEKVRTYFDEHRIREEHYYLVINRLVPENSYEMIIREFMKSKTKNDFIIVSNINQETKFYEKLKTELQFEKDPRIKFVGTVYDQEILAWLRQKAIGYINGHTLGGTNPGLLEALATTDVNLVRDCAFSREGADDTAFYFDDEHPMSALVERVDQMTPEERKTLGARAKERMRTEFSWDKVNEQYVELFEKIISDKKKLKEGK